MADRIAYEEPKKRGRKPGTKNKPGHRAGRPSNGNGQKQCGAAVPKQDSSLPTGKDPGRPITPTRIAYDTPMPCTDGHNCPGGNGNGHKLRICENPSPNLPAKPIGPFPPRGVMAAVAQSGENPELITPEQLIREIQKIATFEIRMLFDKNGNPLPINELSDQAAAAISSYSAVPIVYEGKVVIDPRDPEGKRPLCKVNLSCWSKTAAQDQLNKWHGLYAKDKVAVNAQFNQYNQVNIGARPDLSRLSDEELEQLNALLAKTEVSDVLDVESGAVGL